MLKQCDNKRRNATQRRFTTAQLLWSCITCRRAE